MAYGRKERRERKRMRFDPGEGGGSDRGEAILFFAISSPRTRKSVFSLRANAMY